ncbi:hypothetical protein E2C01_063624 [Portunus trituberculatus]|uniref:Uncharacterized protein n=1 Tax=Portunus trituberculatus TaxID=210409 RepID=A0A5B7H9M7_PORTR|nr:hypothetical protein [Portunus trituberculatus]
MKDARHPPPAARHQDAVGSEASRECSGADKGDKAPITRCRAAWEAGGREGCRARHGDMGFLCRGEHADLLPNALSPSPSGGSREVNGGEGGREAAWQGGR